MNISEAKQHYKATKYACYATNVTMAAVGCISALLFVTFRNTYNISYTLLGLLVVINFSTQLLVDLIFSFFSKHFNIKLTVRITPLISVVGMLIYAIMPAVFPDSAYLWLALGTVIFSISSGLSEVLISPVIASIPSENPEREMSKLHSIYAWGVVGVVIFGTVFLEIFKSKSWSILVLILALLPAAALALFMRAPMPEMDSQDGDAKSKSPLKFSPALLACVVCIFLGGAAECTMTQWVSSFIESALGVPKMWGDIFGMAVFAALLGLGRSLYAKYGRNIGKVLTLGMCGATVCYLIASLSMSPILSLIGCVATGFCVSMLWPGSLILMEERVPAVGVGAYALMAAGGDLGASVAPQLVGIVTDVVKESALAGSLSASLGISTEQIGMRAGILLSALFPLAGVALLLAVRRAWKKHDKNGITDIKAN